MSMIRQELFATIFSALTMFCLYQIGGLILVSNGALGHFVSLAAPLAGTSPIV